MTSLGYTRIGRCSSWSALFLVGAYYVVDSIHHFSSSMAHKQGSSFLEAAPTIEILVPHEHHDQQIF